MIELFLSGVIDLFIFVYISYLTGKLILNYWIGIENYSCGFCLSGINICYLFFADFYFETCMLDFIVGKRISFSLIGDVIRFS